jgi:hypothetical protein
VTMMVTKQLKSTVHRKLLQLFLLSHRVTCLFEDNFCSRELTLLVKLAVCMIDALDYCLISILMLQISLACMHFCAARYTDFRMSSSFVVNTLSLLLYTESVAFSSVFIVCVFILGILIIL